MIDAALFASDRRGLVLKLLAQSGGLAANEHLLQSALRSFGHDVSRDCIRADLAWLQEQGLITIQEVSALYIAKLSQRGLDVAAVRVKHPGVACVFPEG